MADAQAKPKSPSLQLQDPATSSNSVPGDASGSQLPNQYEDPTRTYKNDVPNAVETDKPINETQRPVNEQANIQNEGAKPTNDPQNQKPPQPYNAPNEIGKQTPATEKPPNEAYKPPPDNYKAPTEPYKQSTASSEYYSSESYKPPSDTVNKTTASESRAETRPAPGYQPPTFQNQSRSSTGGQNYQTPNYQPTSNYQQSFQQPKTTPPPPATTIKREASSSNLQTSRSNPYQPSTGSSIQRQPPVNASQRSYMPSSNQPRPPAPATVQRPPQQAPRSGQSTYTPAPSSYTSSSTASRPGQHLSQSYTPSRNTMSQRPVTTAASGLYSTTNSTPARTTSGLSYPSRSPETGQWPMSNSGETRSTSRAFSPSFLLDEGLKTAPIPPPTMTNPVEKAAMQAKFKALLNQNVGQPSLDSSTIPPRPAPVPSETESSVTENRTLSRIGSEVKIVTPNSNESNKEDYKNLSEASLNDDPDDDDDDDDVEDEFTSQKEVPLTETFVSKSVKYFEQKDKAKVPLVPKSPTLERKDKPIRPTHIDIVNKDSNFDDDDVESGVDESPVKHPNLRSISNPPKKVARISSGSSRRRGTSYPGTPTRVVSAPPPLSTPQTPKRQVHSARFKPEEELTYYFRNPVKKTRFSQINGAESSNGDVDREPRQRPNGVLDSPKQPPSKIPSSARKVPASPSKTPLKSPGATKSAPKTPDSPAPLTPLIKKVPMNKIQVGAAPSPNLKEVRSKIGSLANTTHKPGGGNIKIESHKVDFSRAQPRIAAKNDTYAPSGGEKKIQQVKLQWNAKPKVGSLGNASYRPGGGEKKIESVKLDFKEKAKSKVGSKDNVRHVPGGGSVKIENHKLEIKAQSKIGSLDNVKHKPGGGEVKIFDDKTYIKQSSAAGSGTQNDCALSVESEVRGSDEATDISIKKTTTVNTAKPELSKTTHVTVVTKSPSKQRRDVVKSPSTHEVKITYSAVTSPTKQRSAPTEPVQVIKVPVSENAPILNPSVEDKDAHAKPQLPPFLSSSSERKEVGKPVVESKALNGKTDSLPESKHPDSMLSPFLQNEIATNEKVGEIWKDAHNASFSSQSTAAAQKQAPPPKPIPQPIQSQVQSVPPNQPTSQNAQNQRPTQQPPQHFSAANRPSIPQQQQQQQQQRPQNDPILQRLPSNIESSNNTQRPQQLENTPSNMKPAQSENVFPNQSHNQRPTSQTERQHPQNDPSLPIQRPLYQGDASLNVPRPQQASDNSNPNPPSSPRLQSPGPRPMKAQPPRFPTSVQQEQGPPLRPPLNPQSYNTAPIRGPPPPEYYRQPSPMTNTFTNK